MAIKVGIIEDHKQTREMLTVLVSGSQGYECVCAFETGEEAVEKVPNLDINVLLVDIHLSGKISGIDCITSLKVSRPDIQFLICTSFEDSDSIFNALKAGASGYLTKSMAPSKILESIIEAYNGGAPMSSQIARKVISFFQENKSGKKNIELEKLSVREQEILTHLSKGYRYKEIASMLFISIETVRKHIHNMYGKLQVDSRTDALNKVFPK